MRKSRENIGKMAILKIQRESFYFDRGFSGFGVNDLIVVIWNALPANFVAGKFALLNLLREMFGSLLYLQLVHLEQRRPLLLVAFDLRHQALKLRRYFNQQLKTWLYFEIYAANL